MNDVSLQRKTVVSRMKDLLKGILKDVMLGIFLPFIYSRAAKAAVDSKKVIFLESRQKKMSNNFQVLYERLEETKEYRLECLLLGQHGVSYIQYIRNCVAALRSIATAHRVFVNDASDIVSCIPLRSETQIIQLWHACGAFKKWGMSTADLKFGGTREQIMRHPFYKNISLVTVSSPEVVWAYAEAMVLEKRREIIQPLGVSRTDIFFDEVFLSSAKERVLKAIPQVHNKKILLYAPTFRGRVSKAIGPDQLDIAAFSAVLRDKYVLLIKHHPFVKRRPLIPVGCESFAFDVSEQLAIEDLLCVADVCISDYSSLVFEYSLFERPMIFFAFDESDYDDWRGFYYDYDSLTPGPVFEDNGPMIEYVLQIDEAFDKSEVVAFKNKFMSACDGHATERIIKAAL